MKKAPTYAFARLEQASETAWNAVNEFAALWNRDHADKLVDSTGFLWLIRFADRADPAAIEFAEAVGKALERNDIKYNMSVETLFDANDYATLDFIEIMGIGLEEFPGRAFFLNLNNALGESVACPTCGWQDMFSVGQKAPFAIDESLLDEALPEGGDRPAGGWDCVNTPHGHLIVSHRIVDALKRDHVRGYEVLPVHAGNGGRVSRRMFQLRCARSVFVLRRKDGIDSDAEFCATCGVALARPLTRAAVPDPTSGYCVAASDLQGDQLFSRNPGRGARVYVAQSVYRTLLDIHPNGLLPSDALALCSA